MFEDLFTKALLWLTVFTAAAGFPLAYWADKGVLRERTKRLGKDGAVTFAFLVCCGIALAYASTMTMEEKQRSGKRQGASG